MHQVPPVSGATTTAPLNLFTLYHSQCIHMEGHLSFPPGVLQGRPQGVFSPSNAGLTHSPVQILGRELIVCSYILLALR